MTQESDHLNMILILKNALAQLADKSNYRVGGDGDIYWYGTDAPYMRCAHPADVAQEALNNCDHFESHYSDGSTKTHYWTLYRKGFRPLTLRKMFGKYEILAYTSGNGDERWRTVNLPEKEIVEQIQLYTLENS